MPIWWLTGVKKKIVKDLFKIKEKVGVCGFGVWVLRVTGGMVLGRRSRRHLRMDYLILRSRVSLLGREELRSGRRSVCCFGVVGLVRSRDMAQVL